MGGVNPNDLERKLVQIKKANNISITAKLDKAVLLIERLPINKEARICEIGGGAAKSLRQLRELGFRNILGVESSKARATIAATGYGLDIICGDFESEKVQSNLKILAPINVFLSHHVLEHVYYPDEMLRKIAQLQNGNDFFVVGVPNFLEESGFGTLFYLPHLHSFTGRSLSLLLNRHGYEITPLSVMGAQYIDLVSRKKGTPVELNKTANPTDCFEAAVGKLRRDLRLDVYLTGPRYYWCWPDYVERREKSQLGGRMGWWFKSNFSKERRSKKLRSAIVSPLEKRFTSPRESPIEIQFNGPIQLLVV